MQNHDVTEKKAEDYGLKSHEKGKRSKEKNLLHEAGEEKIRGDGEIFKTYVMRGEKKRADREREREREREGEIFIQDVFTHFYRVDICTDKMCVCVFLSH